ncbi:MAG TPA: hypothetical protein VEO96_07310 [Thermoplasmata archaeon]|nr:hypothetical protein [Thermoplasmata archaeon]
MGNLRFLLDENLLYEAHAGVNEKGREDYSAGRLVLAIADKCHKIALDNELRKRYQSKLKELESVRGQAAVNVSKVLNLIMRNSGKVYVPLSRTTHLSGDVPDDDRPLVELAIDARALFITTDDRLISRLGKLSILTKHRLEVLRPEDAVGRASAD